MNRETTLKDTGADFKVGDKVITTANGFGYTKGKVGVIIAESSPFKCCQVKFTDKSISPISIYFENIRHFTALEELL